MGTVMLASLALTGCGGKEDGAGDKAEKNNDTVDKIVIFQSKVDIIDQLEALSEDYKEETGVEVEVWEAPGDDYYQQLKSKLANNQGPTLMSFVPGTESEQMKNYLTDLSDLSFTDKIAEGMADVIDGKTVGIPYTVEGFGVVI